MKGARLVGQIPHLEQRRALEHLHHLKETSGIFVGKHIGHEVWKGEGVFLPCALLKQLVKQPVWVKLHQVFVALAYAGEDDRATGGKGDGEACTTLGIGVHLG